MQNLDKKLTNTAARMNLRRKDYMILEEDCAGFDFAVFDKENLRLMLIKAEGVYLTGEDKQQLEQLERSPFAYFGNPELSLEDDAEREHFKAAMLYLVQNAGERAVKRYNPSICYSVLNVSAYGGEGADKPEQCLIRHYIHESHECSEEVF